MTSNETKKKTVTNGTVNLSDDEIVTKCLTNFKKLRSLKQNFIDVIATLEDHFTKEEICLSMLSLLNSRISYERFMRKIREFAADKNSLPRSLRLKIELNPDMPDTVRTQKFLAEQEAAKETVELFQKKFKKHFRVVKEADRDVACEEHKDNFFRHFFRILDAKSCYMLAKSTYDTRK